jgi:mRNA interferase HigB
MSLAYKISEMVPPGLLVDMHRRRTIFDVGGNKYRLIARVNFEQKLVFVLHVLTHPEYDKGGWNK